MNSTAIEYPNNCQMYKKCFLLTRCYQARTNTEECTKHEALLCFDRSDLWNRWFVIYWSETDSTELRKSLIKGNHASHFAMRKNSVYWLAVSTDFDATTSRCSTCANFRHKTKQNKLKWSLCHKRKKSIQNMS